MFLADAGLIYRGIRPLQKLGALAIGHPLAGLSMPPRVPECLLVVPPDPWSGDAQRGRDMIAGAFRFAGQTVSKEDLSWHPVNAKEEWLAELHGFEWLRDLRSAGGDRARRMARDMAANWLFRFRKPEESIAWRPDVVGARLAAWISFHDFFCASADEAFRHDYFSSLVRQARFLEKALPAGLCGLDAMRALKGLAYSGLALEGGEERLEQAFAAILREVREQVLPDGGHISRSPQATFEVMRVLVDLRTALTAARLDMPEELQHAIDRMAPAVKFFRHGDGALCHFNGGQEGNAHICEATLMQSGARGRAMKSLPHCGYEKIQLGRSSLIMDVGLPLSSRYADRAHAGLLSFEYAFGKDRVIVNCGTSAVRGKWRELLRTTAAHSTLTVDHRNACQFEEGGLMSSRPEIAHKSAEEAGIALIEASHTGYMPRYGLTHLRRLRLQDAGETLCGEERLTGKSGVHFNVRFHLHPCITASLIKDGEEILLRARSGMGWRFRAAGAGLGIEDSIYAGEGEVPRRTLQIFLNGVTGHSPTTVTWELMRDKI